MSGRPRKPSALKLIEGNPGKRAANSNEPEPLLLNDLEPPKHLSDRSAAVWREVAPILRANQVLTVMDTLALEMLCDCVADYRLAREKRGEKFVTTSPKTGSPMLEQLLIAQQMCGKRAEGLMSKFAMDPTSRSRVMVNPQGDLFGAPPAATGTERFFK